MPRMTALCAFKRFLPFLLLGAGVFCIVLGLSRRELPVMFEKAVRICLECIGIG